MFHATSSDHSALAAGASGGGGAAAANIRLQIAGGSSGLDPLRIRGYMSEKK